ncbi:unnamed protein product [Allacma fusca]|uniref:Uncharacterized protein n=1 Tax=Allacma fusca TaxID=39272 RepID=A0A8J2JXP9_9HEXA|nr:unnamed protein product [Allacma fusca]
MAQLIFIYSFWFKRHRFLEVFRHVSQESDRIKYLRERNSLTPTLISIILVFGQAFGFDTLAYLFKTGKWTWSHIYYAKVNAFKDFFNGIYIFKDYDKPYVQIYIVLHSIVVALYKLYNAFCDLCPIYTALLFKTLVSNYLQMLQSEEDPLVVWSHYKNLKKHTEKINAAMGLLIFIFFIGSIPYFAEDLVDVVNGSTDVSEVVKSLYYLLSSFTIVLVIAHSHHIQASATRAWIFREDVQCKLPDIKLHSILSEVCCEQESIGLNGAGMFTINYGFVGTAVPLVLTYAVLSFQLQAAGIDRKSLGCQN